MDAPKRKQPFGERARQALAELTFRKEAELRCTKIDRHKRQVCSTEVAPASAPSGPRTLDTGLLMVTQGIAWWYREQSSQERGKTSLQSKKRRLEKLDFGEIPSQSRRGIGVKPCANLGRIQIRKRP
ncbi:thermonuclease family protein [Comamonas brasiliensis]|uniref:thermonuclease family protein n=1 Tax=Comamonas brasiliensis TaxID=1812482 RepID=UPI003AEF8C2F